MRTFPAEGICSVGCVWLIQGFVWREWSEQLNQYQEVDDGQLVPRLKGSGGRAGLGRSDQGSGRGGGHLGTY